jgi:hypothetical protein
MASEAAIRERMDEIMELIIVSREQFERQMQPLYRLYSQYQMRLPVRYWMVDGLLIKEDPR